MASAVTGANQTSQDVKTTAQTLSDENATTRQKAAAIVDTTLSAVGTIGSAMLAASSASDAAQELAAAKSYYQKAHCPDAETAASGGGSAAKFYNPDGSPIWPPNRGFDGASVKYTLEPGTMVDRYGYDGGTFVAPKGTPYSERALPIGTDKKPYTVFEVVQPVEVQAGKIAPWFGEKGGGIQYEFSQPISDLIGQGILRKVEY